MGCSVKMASSFVLVLTHRLRASSTLASPCSNPHMQAPPGPLLLLSKQASQTTHKHIRVVNYSCGH